MTVKSVDVLLVGAGAMSSTLAMILKQLDPSLKITVVERLPSVASESTDGWNNAGTGHAAYCELNYTPEDQDGHVDISKALTINSSFEISLQFWSHLVNKGVLPEPSNFINRTPHMSFVWGEKNVNFLRNRYLKMSQHHLFEQMEFSDDAETLRQWMPLVMNGRKSDEPVAGTYVKHGSDVDFGSLARYMVDHLSKQDDFEVLLNHDVEDLKRSESGGWSVKVEDRSSGKETRIKSKFVFLGAGGGALPLLQRSGIDEADGYGGFPVSGQWLVCTDPEVVEQHHAKVYGKAAIGAPPMSVPHLDTRVINGKRGLLFGPFAGFTTKFLKKGSIMDLPLSVRPNNLLPMMSVGKNNMDLTRYLISEVFQSDGARMEALRQYFPQAQDGNWTLADAGKRVQIIKKDEKGKGKLEFGTEIVAAKDGSIAALLGASPGASTAVHAMIDVIERCFADRLEQDGWKQRLKEMVPSYGESLKDDAELLKRVRDESHKTLGLYE
ncbi:malate:quinone oxidoreductase [Bermanella marisrubri]|uniref:Probable malate:quinone oxidoreductase n=1 Tax=Bermanella marisrubri TaxID=207949 RepID=Q1MZF7_9GAMM|nr:malate:quinone oxidoreductase [Bermanella marisrubri]EAT11309.1 malate:quinone-oxidoreductase [Oceanobacter sp. RED65] [Bermanella marisrubri]QIZ85303.1 malate:quinone oxidoreductase [Bermanella marisrubri]